MVIEKDSFPAPFDPTDLTPVLPNHKQEYISSPPGVDTITVSSGGTRMELSDLVPQLSTHKQEYIVGPPGEDMITILSPDELEQPEVPPTEK